MDTLTTTESPLARRSRLTISIVRSAVGAGSWLSPTLATRAFAPGLIEDHPGSVLVGRLFGIRDLALGQAVLHPHPAVRRAALQAGVAVDAADAVATAVAFRRGASKLGAASTAAGALTFVVLGLVALAAEANDTAAPADPFADHSPAGARVADQVPV